MTGPGAAPRGLAFAGGSPTRCLGRAAAQLPGSSGRCQRSALRGRLGAVGVWCGWCYPPGGAGSRAGNGDRPGPLTPEPQALCAGLGQAREFSRLRRDTVADSTQKALLCAFHPSCAGPRVPAEDGGSKTHLSVSPPSSRPQPEAQPVSGHEQPRNEPWAPRAILSGCRRTGGFHGTEAFFPPALLFSRGCLLGTKAWGIAQPRRYCQAGPVINRQPVPLGSRCNQERIGTFHTSSSTVCQNPQPGRHRGHGTR